MAIGNLAVFSLGSWNFAQQVRELFSAEGENDNLYTSRENRLNQCENTFRG